MKPAKDLGRWGEEVATQYLVSQGYIVLERNMRAPHGEIDIIAIKEDVLIFVEVKMRSSNAFGYPEDAVNYRKQTHLFRAAEYYFENHPDSPETWQFDIVAITRHVGLPPEIEHFQNVIG